MIEVRKTIRFTKDDVDFIMNDKSLKDWRLGYRDTSFSERLREIVRLYRVGQTDVHDGQTMLGDV